MIPTITRHLMRPNAGTAIAPACHIHKLLANRRIY